MFLLPSKYVAVLLISFCAYLFTQFFISYNTCYGSSVCVPYLYDVALLKHTPTNMHFDNNLSGWYCCQKFLHIFEKNINILLICIVYFYYFGGNFVLCRFNVHTPKSKFAQVRLFFSWTVERGRKSVYGLLTENALSRAL